VLGHTVEQWATEGEVFVRLLDPDDRDRVRAEHEHTRSSDEPLHPEHRLLSADGDVIWIRDEPVIVGSRDGGQRLLQGFLIDITERRPQSRRCATRVCVHLLPYSDTNWTHPPRAPTFAAVVGGARELAPTGWPPG
jgi:PAS domain S-box-containing protein